MEGEFLILPSSPPRKFANFSLSSSPPRPSLEDMPQEIRTGSRAAPIPDNASASFTSAATLLKSTPSLNAIGAFAFGTDDSKEKPAKIVKARKSSAKKADTESKVTKKPGKAAAIDGEVDVTVAEKKPRKPRAKKNTEIDGDAAEKPAVTRKPRVKKVELDEFGNAIVKEKPVRKSRAKKADGDAQPKLAKGKVTKSSTAAESKPGKTKSKIVKPEVDSPLDLPMATKRRVDWTPPLPASKIVGIAETVLSSGGLASAQKGTGFADLFGNYGFTKLESTTNSVSSGPEITRKRKLIELVKTSVATSAAMSPVAKEKAPKKKARTITEQATSAYAEIEEELPVPPAPLLQYFSIETTERTTSDGFKIPPKPRSKSPVKNTSKSKKGSAQAPILLSPESAMKQVGNQDFVFGTSSQLAREESPGLLRDLHAAMQASNEEVDPFADSVFDSSPPVPRRSSGIAAKRNLWSAASRDDSGELLDVPMIDLVDSPAIDTKLTVPATMATPVQSELDIWHDIGTTPPPSSQPVFHTPKVMGAMGPIEAAIRAELLNSPSGSRPARSPKIEKKLKDGSLHPIIKSPRSKAKSSKSPAKGKQPTGLQMPNFEAYTDAQLTKEIASYKFKPIKKRDQMILLLERCWKSKHASALNSLSTNVPVVLTKVVKDAVSPSSRPTDAPAKKPRGRPRKETTIQYLEMDSDTPLSQSRTPKKTSKRPTQTTEDISDSDTHVTPSPPRRKSSQMSPLPLKRLASDSNDSIELSPEDEQELLFKHIYRAVTEAPRSKDPINPNWHEKILLYDPIVLEDLTVWLNTGGLETVGWDGEVDPKLVKKWCESKSICCLWRENLRGGARSRY